MVMEEQKNTTICFTGHRSQNLPWKFDESDYRYKKTYDILIKKLENYINLGKIHFISGMALGFDTMCAKAVLKLREKYSNITLECAIPCKDQESKWQKKDKLIYRDIVNRADKVTILADSYTPWCMQNRNKYIVDNSSVIIALFNGSRGGTKNTIEYAKKMNREIDIIDVIYN